MKREIFVENVRSFLNSKEFRNRKVEFDGKKFIDKKTGILYGFLADSLKEIEDFPQPLTPMVFVSSTEEVLEKISDAFHSDKWNAERFETMTGEELDYAYLRQCSLLNRKKDLPLFVSKNSKKKKK